MSDSEILTIHDSVLMCDGDTCTMVKLCNVRYFETYGNYSQIYFNSDKLIIYRTLSHICSRLSDKYFFRANRQYLLNLSHLDDIFLLKNNTFRIVMNCGKTIDLSRRKSKALKKKKCYKKR